MLADYVHISSMCSSIYCAFFQVFVYRYCIIVTTLTSQNPLVSCPLMTYL